jgi:hypothetical protein
MRLEVSFPKQTHLRGEPVALKLVADPHTALEVQILLTTEQAISLCRTIAVKFKVTL